jgi:hypothetical protein
MLLRLPPGGHRPLQLRTRNGDEILGWRIFDSVAGTHRYWRWAPARAGGRAVWEKKGVVEVQGVVSWSEVALPEAGPLSRREAEVLLRRGVLTDGFKDKRAVKVRSQLELDGDDDREAWDEAAGKLNLFGKWVPEPYDHDNYLIAMGWFARLGREPDGARIQRVVRWRALGFSFKAIGENWLHLSRERARYLYNSGVDQVWGWALAEEAGIRRLPRDLWDTSSPPEAG